MASGKLECGLALCVLGVMFTMSERGFHCKPAADKVRRWLITISEALKAEHLAPGCASKLAGRLSWGGSQLFNRLGRAMLRAIFDQKTRRDGHMSRDLVRSLQWWQTVLSTDIAELRTWERAPRAIAHLFCDASSSPPYLGAVLFIDNECWFTHMAPSTGAVELFRRRRDNQIMGLELLAISLGLCSFEGLIRGSRLVVHSDNTGSEVSFRRGTARSLDHAQLVHTQWLQVARLGLEVWVKRVRTEDNIADLPSRRVRHSCCVLRCLPVCSVLPGFCAAERNGGTRGRTPST